MLDEKQAGLLRDILDSAEAVLSYLEGITEEEFLSRVEKQDAVLRRFEIIGEAASRLTGETQALFPNLPFQKMRGMRNIIIHNYSDVDLDRVWQTARTELRPLIEALGSKVGSGGNPEP